MDLFVSVQRHVGEQDKAAVPQNPGCLQVAPPAEYSRWQ